MSESSEHLNLVTLMARRLALHYPNVAMENDLQTHPGESVPRIINGHRPDIYAYLKGGDFCIIGEAKTMAGLDNNHTYSQMISFVSYLETISKGIFVLGVSGEKSSRAKTLLRFVAHELRIVSTTAQVFDGLDFWTLDKENKPKWHLS